MTGSPSDTSREVVRQEVVKTFHLLTDAWNRGDLETLAKPYHREISGIEPDIPHRTCGKEKVLQGYRTFLESGGKIHYLDSRDIRVQVLGETALLTCSFKTRRTLPGNRSAESTGKESLVFSQQEGIWKLVHWHYSTNPFESS